MTQIDPRVMGTEMEYGFYKETANQSDVNKHLPEGVKAIKEWLSNGARLYIDMQHKLEYAGPECLGAEDATHAEFSGEVIVGSIMRSMVKAGFARMEARKCVVDDEGKTWGYHENYLAQRSHFDKLPYKPFMVSHLATRNVLVGAGRLVANGDDVRVLPGQKMHEIVEASGSSSTRNKPLFNTRDEALATKEAWGRQHIICGDPNITGRITTLKLASTSLVMRLGELRFGDTSKIILNDELGAAHLASSDITHRKRTKTISGKSVSALDMQEMLLSQCEDMSQKYELPPDEVKALRIWRELVDALRHNTEQATQQIEWLAKTDFVKQYMERKKPRTTDERNKYVKAIDRAWDNLDPKKNIGKKWMTAHDPDVLDEFLVEEYIYNPPPYTRAALRGAFVAEHHAISGLYEGQMSWDKAIIGRHKLFMPSPFGRKD